jgi:archaeosine synthase beta-subunit
VIYPATPAARDRFVLDRRGPKAALDPARAHAAVWEEERDAAGRLASTAVVFLTNRECPFRCTMCDLWVHTLDVPVARGGIAGQIRLACAGLPAARHIKLYNAGSFFDPQAIPVDDFAEIAEAVAGFDRVIVEAHPAFLEGRHGEACLRFRDLVGGRLEVAVGLETAHPTALAAINKRMTLESFGRAAAFLGRHQIALRVFVLLDPPFVPQAEAAEWALTSVRTAAAHGATVCAVIPTRGGNGALEALPYEARPRLGLRDLEQVIERSLADGRGRSPMRVFADLWDLERLFDCSCSPARAARLAVMNREQRLPEAVMCACSKPDAPGTHP